MTLKITLTIDQENDQATVLIGLLAKALGRSEAGVSELRIEHDGPRDNYANGFAEGKKLSKIAAKVATIPKQKSKRRAPGLGTQTRGDKPNSVRLTLRALTKEPTLEGLRATWSAGGLSPNGVGATLSKMARRGLCKRVREGVWRILPQGEELLAKWSESHED